MVHLFLRVVGQGLLVAWLYAKPLTAHAPARLGVVVFSLQYLSHKSNAEPSHQSFGQAAPPEA